MLRKLAAVLVLSAPALPALAADGFVDAYYVPSSRLSGDGGGSISGDGYGLKASVPVGSVVFFNGEFQRDTYRVDGDSGWINQYRVGVGAQTSPDKARAAVWIEYAGLHGSGDSTNPNGVGLHSRVSFTLAPPFQVYAEAGYVLLSSKDSNSDSSSTADGPEFLAGAAFSFTERLGVFADYRFSRLNGENGGGRIDFNDFRVGARLNL